MANEFNIDPNVWYQISNDLFDPKVNSLRVGDSHTAIYMFATNLTSPQQRWQIFPVSGGGGGWNFRAQITGSGAYMSQCVHLTSTTAPTDANPDDTDVCMALGAAADIQRQWILSSNGDGTFDIKLSNSNPLYSDYHLFVNESNTVAFTDDTTEEGVKWGFQSIMPIDDPAFSTGIVPVASTSTTRSATSTSTNTSVPTSPGSQTPTQTQTQISSPTTSSAPTQQSRGLSSGAAAGVGVAVAIAVLALAAILFWFFRRRRKHTREQRQRQVQELATPYSGQDGASFPHETKNRRIYPAEPAELHHQSLAELDHTPERKPPVAELGADPRASRG
ncbi:hypothetical protein G647_01373 [Cladophialophora carrionii CBS 160.54]|uniref:Ricin B lectin domain-containing protein n=1 Tax=Cladophialophora carrionii CBS 160.54 TaxID=1279043 RepID=V9DQK8_9EURO|nr:uncharacterized protein G647_01373 [Cladophialophora carrionii CBS 160.54]ETI28921.1 hypothetical protein G647_01373 [Cladophialophora carrionii CBS 160.54]